MKFPKELSVIAKKSKIQPKEIEKKYIEAQKEAQSMGKGSDENFILDILKSLINYKESYKKYESFFKEDNSMISQNFGGNVRPSDSLYYPKTPYINITAELQKQNKGKTIPNEVGMDKSDDYDYTWQNYVDRIPYADTPEEINKQFVFAKDLVKNKELKKNINKNTKIKMDVDDNPSYEESHTIYKSYFEDEGGMTSQGIGTTPEKPVSTKQLKKKKKKDTEDEEAEV